LSFFIHKVLAGLFPHMAQKVGRGAEPVYNPQLETFIRVAEAGSFSKAAEKSYITPTAVIKQINSLESALSLHLFTRTHRGLTLTESGRSLYDDAKYVVSYCKESVKRAKEATQNADATIRIGTSPMTPGEFLLDLWPKACAYCPDMKLRLVPFENTPENAREILRNLGKNIDVVGGYFDEAHQEDWGCAALKLKDDPIRCAVSVSHALAAKQTLALSEIRNESLLLIRRGWNTYVDMLRDFATAEEINIIDFDFFNLGVFNRCENSNDILMAFDSWRNAHPLIRILPAKWDFTVPYGLLHSPEPTDTVKQFLDSVRRAIEL
jgi:DNA-binding transcriptional LysR family regulator